MIVRDISTGMLWCETYLVTCVPCVDLQHAMQCAALADHFPGREVSGVFWATRANEVYEIGRMNEPDKR
jgi:hypothetical protein